MEKTQVEFIAAMQAGQLLTGASSPTTNHEGQLLDVARGGVPYVVIPEGSRIADLGALLPNPTRKRGRIICDDAAGFIAYIKKHELCDCTTIYAALQPKNSHFSLTALLDDHDVGEAMWRSHVCRLKPALSLEWERWTGNNGEQHAMSQSDFAAWIEDNLGDVAGVEGMPTGAQMLQMALAFEASADKRFKSAINITSGCRTLEFVDKEDDATRERMQFFSRFTLGIPVFDGGDSAYPVEARLKYRHGNCGLSLWYELIRPDKVLRQACKEVVERVIDETGLPLIFGDPGLVS